MYPGHPAVTHPGKYRLGHKLGTGGMAEVYEGTLIGAEGFSRPVAIKHMLTGLSADPEFEQMFLNEARLAALLHHPNVVSVIDFDRDADGRLFLVMEMVQGTDLRRLMDTGRLPVNVSTHILAKLLEALAYAHLLQHEGRPLGLVHRDVTPHNVLLSAEGHVKLSDFGIAKAVERTSMTRTGMLKGKVSYMSPEQIEGESLDGRSDLFAAGIVLWEMLAGRSLFRGDAASDRVVLNRILIAPIQPPDQIAPDVPQPLSDLCMQLLHRERDQRPPDAQAALSTLIGTGLVDAGGTWALRDLIDARQVQSSQAPTVESSLASRPVPADRSDTRQVPSGIIAPESTQPSAAWATPTLADDTAQVTAPPSTSTSHFDDVSVAVAAPSSSRMGLAAAALGAVAVALAAALWLQQAPSADTVPVQALPQAEAQPVEPTKPSPATASEPATPTPAPTSQAPAARAAPIKTEAAAKKMPRRRRRSARRERAATPAKAAPKPASTRPPAPSKPSVDKPATVAPAEPLGDDILAPSFLDTK